MGILPIFLGIPSGIARDYFLNMLTRLINLSINHGFIASGAGGAGGAGGDSKSDEW